MAVRSRHSAPPFASPPRRRRPPAAAPVGTSEARAWWQHLRASVPRWLLLAVLALLGMGMGLLYGYARA
ncbi:hypothetical protein F0H33_01275 [Xanthomonas translucens pv. undulosa]|uniref:Uncharacterized protein n=2 Tax=Xanthomonas campestris pv. translucens TaxID=343 RepID=A0A109HEX3_XANCT|nr:hypothetical protein FD63_01260 [Xanthomonas translucens pv. undulosa]ELQ11869.1 hypothetical protein A989_07318 [Xanthomonas translucens DAR61454]KTF41205.1 hypothetical protein OZ12_02860 [Xanthomonas translucens pv. translucens]KWV10917.1 hypothetical protein ATB53_01670 [Xanthomonas translucens]KWV11363.1 hypothetical protein ATB54_04905 [Xanthomonas translucens]